MPNIIKCAFVGFKELLAILTCCYQLISTSKTRFKIFGFGSKAWIITAIQTPDLLNFDSYRTSQNEQLHAISSTCTEIHLRRCYWRLLRTSSLNQFLPLQRNALAQVCAILRLIMADVMINHDWWLWRNREQQTANCQGVPRRVGL